LVLAQISPFLKSPQSNLGHLGRRIFDYVTHNVFSYYLKLGTAYLKDDIGLSFIRVAISLIAIKDGAAS